MVELFVAPDAADRSRYLEIEVNPAGLVFDATVAFPGPDRRTMTVDRSWDPPSLVARSRVVPLGDGRLAWLVRLSIAWIDIVAGTEPDQPVAIGAFRIDRTSLDAPLFLALAPSLESPANFHVPARFVPWNPRDAALFSVPPRG